ncbi:MAG: hypothetical protein ACI9GW_002120, partial [Halieaceae bacterium]
TKTGVPPTARKARTGELTPPGMWMLAEAKRDSEVGINGLAGLIKSAAGNYPVSSGAMQTVAEWDFTSASPWSHNCEYHDHHQKDDRHLVENAIENVSFFALTTGNPGDVHAADNVVDDQRQHPHEF